MAKPKTLTTKKKNGRPSRFSAKIQDIIKLLARRGFTDAEMAKCLEITQRTLDNWKKKYSGFFQSLKDWKNEADHEVERSLYERACGYSHPEDKIFNDNGSPLIVPTIKHYPPDTTAGIFWLKNRKKSEWRDGHDLNIKGPSTNYDEMTPEERKSAIATLLKRQDEP